MHPYNNNRLDDLDDLSYDHQRDRRDTLEIMGRDFNSFRYKEPISPLTEHNEDEIRASTA